MEENNENAVSMQKKLQSSQDPGWNDPPAWALSAQKSNTGTPMKRLTNKRLAFPLDSKSTAEAVSTTCPATSQKMPQMPPMPPPVSIASLTTAPHKPVIAPTKAQVDDPVVRSVELDKEDALKSTLDNLCQAMELLDTDKENEIKKRLDRMEVMWNEGKLNKVVHQKVVEISKALKDGDVEKADQLHVSLMMNNASVCSSWMPGIRQIIAEMKNGK